ncbi:MAG: hypothetical protein ACFFG0_50465, partial [Candidatus Thorarchaeota archaeon]
MMDEFVRCLNCGKCLDSKERKYYNYCAECILDLKFMSKDIDQEELNRSLQKILNFFVSDVTAAFKKDPAAHSLMEV